MRGGLFQGGGGRWSFRSALAAWTLLVAGALLAADDRPELPPGVREIIVPADRPGFWPAGDWHPLSRQDYRELLEKLKPAAAEPARAWIENAEYTATLVGDALRGGRLTAQVRRRGDEPTLLSLDPLGLALTKLTWAPTPADDSAEMHDDVIWGMSPGGQTAVYLDRASGELHGEWTLRGHRLAQALDFEVQVAPATASVLRLRLPPDARLESTRGAVIGPDDTATDGLSTWEVQLGTETQCRLRVVTAQAVEPEQPIVLSEHETSCLVREDGLHFQEKISIEVFNTPVEALQLRLPRGLDVYSVSHGETPVAWKQSGARLQIDFPEPLLGRHRSIRVQALAPARIGRDWPLPRLTVEDAFFTAGRMHLEVENPLELQDLSLHGSRQIATVVRAGQVNSYTFEEYAPDARVVVHIGRPQLALSARIVSHLQVASHDWSLASQVQWTCQSGSTFTARLQVAPGWDVTDVHLGSGTDGTQLLQWRVENVADRNVLALDFAEALKSGRTQTVEILARRRSDQMAEDSTPVPVLNPVDAQAAEHVIAVTSSSGETPQVRPGSALQPIEPGSLPVYAERSKLWQDLLARSLPEKLILLRAVNPTSTGEVLVERTSREFDTESRVVIDFEGDRTAEQVALRVVPKGAPVEAVRVYLSSPGPDTVWRQIGAGENVLSAERLPAERHGQWQLPSTGELWELRLAVPSAEPFTILANRTRSVAPGGALPLAFVPESRNFEGTVEVRATRGRLPDVEAIGLQSLENGTSDRGSGTDPTIPRSRWRYAAVSDALTVTALVAGTDIDSSRAVTLRLRSRLTGTRGGEDLHRAEFQIGPLGSPRRFRFELPESCRLVAASLDGQPVDVSRQDSEYALPVMAAGAMHRAEIQYRSPSFAGFLQGSNTVPAPRTRYKVLDFRWDVILPEHLALAAAPEGMQLDQPLPEGSWTERIFGPLGRSSAQAFFNPLSLSGWGRLISPEGVASAMRSRASADEFAPPGWAVYRAAAPSVPERLRLQTWNEPRGRLVAWTVLLLSLLIGFLLRFGKVAGRARIGASLLSLALVAALILPPHWAMLAGASFIGGLLALLIPQRLVTPRLVRAETLSVGSTETFARAGLAGVLLAAILGGLAAHTADAQTPPQLPGAESGRAVLIPVQEDSDASELPEVVYVSAPLWNTWQRLNEQPADAAKYLITSAIYEAAINESGPATLTARFQIVLLPGFGSARLSLPITDAQLIGPDACRVDGQPTPVLPGETGYVIDHAAASDRPNNSSSSTADEDAPVEAPVYRGMDGPLHAATDRPLNTVTLELQLRVPVTPTSGGRRLEMGIPAVLSSRASIRIPDNNSTAMVTTAAGEIVRAENGNISADLGKASHLRIDWSERAGHELRAEGNASVFGLVEVHPTLLKYRYRTAYTIEKGGVRSVVWQIPRQMIPQTVSVGSPAELLGWHVSPEPNGTSGLLIEFTDPQTEEFSVEASLILPVRSEDEQIAVPAIDLLAADPTFGTAPASQQLGASTTPHFQLEPADPPANGPNSPLSVDSLFDKFARALSAAAGVGRPSFAWQVQPPRILQFRLVPVIPHRKVWLSQIGRVGLADVAWTISAEIETTSAPAFQHRLHIDPLLQIESVLVQEDEVDRLARWVRHGDRLTLYLSDRTTGVQNVTIRGTAPLRADENLSLPVIAAPEAELVDSRLDLYHAPEVQVDFANASEFEVLVGPLPSAFNGSGAVPIGQYRLTERSPAPRLAVRPRSDRPTVDSFTVVTGGAGERCHLHVLFQFHQPTAARLPVRVELPDPFTAPETIRPRNASHRLENSSDGGSQILVLTPDEGVSDFAVAVSGPVAHPSTGDRALAVPQALACEPGEAYLAISPEVPLRPADPAATLKAADLPPWTLSSGLPATTQAARVYRGRSLDWNLRETAEQTPDRSAIALSDTDLWLQADGSLHGTTTLVLPSGPARRLPIRWPDALEFRAALLDGRLTESTAPADGELIIPVPASDVPQTASLRWAHPSRESWWPLANNDVTLPGPRASAAFPALLSLRASESLWLLGSSGFGEQSRLVSDLSRLSALLEVCRGVDSNLLRQAPLWREITWLERRLTRSARQLSPENRDQLARLRQQIREQNERSPDELAPAASSLGFDMQFASSSRAAAAGLLDAGQAPRVSLWSLDRSAANWGLALMGLVVAVPVTGRIIRSRPGEWLQRHAIAAFALLGLIWWLCLSPSAVGPVILLLAAGFAWRDARPRRRGIGSLEVHH